MSTAGISYSEGGLCYKVATCATKIVVIRMRYVGLLLILILLSINCLAQRPAPPFRGPSASDVISVDLLLPIKDSNLSNLGVGGQFAVTHFFGDHFGTQFQGDYMRTGYLDFHDASFREGPIIRLAARSAIQPYVRVLVGYSQVKDRNLKPTMSYHGSGSILGGGGIDFPLSGAWYGRVGADLQEDWTVHQRSARGVVGFSYRFGARQSRL